MISQELIDTIQDALDLDIEIENVLTAELLDNYIKVIEDNARLHKELTKLHNRLDVIESS